MAQASTVAIAPWREKIRVVIFEADTPAGKAFDVALLAAIVISVTAVMFESVGWMRGRYGLELDVVEWVFTVLFTIEYVLRLISVPRPLQYARSFFGIVDLLAILPTYISVLVPGAESFLVIRGLRLLRIFRVFKLGRFLGDASILSRALASSRHKVTIFLGTVLILVTILGAAMYLIEGEEHGFTSIAPETVAGKTLAAMVMILGYSIIAVPTGIVTAEIVESAAAARRPTTRGCPHCLSEGHEEAARYCKDCGELLEVAVE
jgi:voltage-gated potassium channel